jgi:hypothetical protein
VTAAVLATFSSEAEFLAAWAEAGRRGVRVVDAFTPYLPEALATHGGVRGPAIVTAALVIGGLATAALFYLGELLTAAVLYPFDSGGRPPDSWPVFVMGPFEFGVFVAGFCGFVALLVVGALPRPHQPLFGAPGIERASQDAFFLALEPGEAAEQLARDLGAVDTSPVEL